MDSAPRNRFRDALGVSRSPGSDMPAGPKRLTLSAILEQMLAERSRTASDHSSVTLNRNAKGITQIEVVVRSGDAGEITTAEAAAAEATRIYNDLCTAYPLPAEPAPSGGES